MAEAQEERAVAAAAAAEVVATRYQRYQELWEQDGLEWGEAEWVEFGELETEFA